MKRFDPLNEEIEVNLIEDESRREETPTIGYFAMFEYLNGFKKCIYWSRQKMEFHAKKYSKAYSSKYSFWTKDFDAMACKTMLRQLIGKWGVMSTEFERAYTGDMARRRREILRQLEEEGVLTLNKELDMPRLPQRIAVISSPTAAGYGDFCHQLENNSRGFYFYTELFPALMQGDRVEESVLSALDRVNARLSEFDVVVIIRGGGATSDLSGFDTYLLAAACAQFPLPIITGIGHERDDTVLDSVAHTRVKTPTAAAEFLIESMDSAADELEMLASRLHEGVRNLLQQEQRRLSGYKNRIPSAAYHRISDAKMALLTVRKDVVQAVTSSLFRHRHRLELLQQRLADASPEKLLARGYSITLKDGKVVKNADELQENDMITTRLQNGEVVSIVHI